MAEKKVAINLATGLEDAERVTVAFLVGGAALEQGRRVAMSLTKEAVRIGLAGYDESALVPNARLVGRDPAPGVDRHRRCHRVQLLSRSRPTARVRHPADQAVRLAGLTVSSRSYGP